MEENINCNQCGNLINSISKFCSNCGEKLRCSVCNEPLIKDAKFCSSCGTSTIKISENNIQPLNKIKFKETKDERAYEVTFTDAVGSEVTNVVMNMFQNNNKNLLGSQIIEKPSSADGIKKVLNNDDNKDTIEVEIVGKEKNEYPHLNDLILNLELSEKDWIIIFSFYLSEFGNGYFTKELIKAKYKEHRNSAPHMKNYAANYKNAHKQCFSTVNEENLKFSQSGLKKAISLVNGEKKSQIQTKVNKKKSEITAITKTKVSAKSKNIKIEEFDAYNSKPTLEEFFEKIKPVTANERILTIAYYINKVLKNEVFTDGNIDYAYKLLKLDKRPNLLRQIITNIKTKELWFDKSEDGKNWKLNRTGEIYFESKMQKN